MKDKLVKLYFGFISRCTDMNQQYPYMKTNNNIFKANAGYILMLIRCLHTYEDVSF